MKFDVIVADPPWIFSDELKMDSVKRGASSQYSVMKNDDIANLDVGSLTEDNCVLALWVPSSLLKEGIHTMESWGFDVKQTHIWVKVKKNPLEFLRKKNKKKPFKKLIPSIRDAKNMSLKDFYMKMCEALDDFDVEDTLSFYMGRIFRQTHELVLVGTKGKVSSMLKDKSQRSVHFGTVTEHSAKPEDLQDMLDIMYPGQNKLEIFARRQKHGWTCVGNECPGKSFGEDIKDSIKRLEKEK